MNGYASVGFASPPSAPENFMCARAAALEDALDAADYAEMDDDEAAFFAAVEAARDVAARDWTLDDGCGGGCDDCAPFERRLGRAVSFAREVMA